MSIYGNYIFQSNPILESYIDNDFLSCLNESATSKDIKHQCDLIEARIKNGTFKKEDVTKLENMLKDSKDTIPDITGFIYYGLGLVLQVRAITLGSTLGPISAICGLASMYLGLLSLNQSGGAIEIDLSVAKFNFFYDNLMKKEAKAKAELKKAEALDSGKEKEEKIKVYKEIIKVTNKARKEYKNIVKNIENSKAKKTNDYTGKFTESVIVTESGDVEIVNEMKGKDFKNELFIQVIEDANEVFTDKYEYIKELDKSISKIILAGKSINNSNIGSYIVDFRKVGRRLNDMKDKSSTVEDHIIRSLKLNIMKFNNKYSEVGLAERDKLYNKLNDLAKAVDEIYKKYDAETGSINNALINMFDAVEANVDADNAKIKDLKDIVGSWVNGIASASKSFYNQINTIANSVSNKFIKKTPIYMITNFKTYKADRKAEKEEKKAANDAYNAEKKEIKQANKEFKNLR